MEVLISFPCLLTVQMGRLEVANETGWRKLLEFVFAIEDL